MPNFNETISNVKGKWKETMIRFTENKKTKYNNKKNKAIIIGAMAGVLITGLSSLYYYEANAVTLYHVYVDGKEIGIVDNTKIVDDWKNEQLTKAQSEYGLDKLDINNQITFTEEKKFKGKFNNEQAISSLQDVFNIKATGVALVVNGKEVGFVKDQATADSILKKIKEAYAPNQGKAGVMASSTEQKPTNTGTKLETVNIKEEVSFKNVDINPSNIISEADMLNLLKKGSLEEKVYTVQEGDTISEIAYMHNLSTDQLYQLNPELKGEYINIGDELNVTTLTPLVTVETIETVIDTETIDYQIEKQKDSSMFVNESKVIQEGKEGEKEVTYKVKKENGIVVSKEILTEKVTKEPVTKIVKRGTKVAPSRGTGSYLWPTVGGIITSNYGARWGTTHQGIDISGVSDRTIKAADSGTVIQAGWNGGYGKSVIISHGNGVQTLYGHLSTISVSVGDKVGKGQKIGVMGSTGNSTGVHLHFEVLVNGSSRNPLNYVGR